MNFFSFKSILPVFVLFEFSCVSPGPGTRFVAGDADGKYDTALTNPSAGRELEQIMNCTRRVYSQTQYKSYIFSESRKVSPANFDKALLQSADSTHFSQRSVFGSATIILNRSNRIALLSCAHVFDKPDTIITYYQDRKTGKKSFVASLSIKQQQRNLVTDILNVRSLELIAIDRENDIAILGQRWMELSQPLVSVLYYPFGKERDLDWGTAVYLVGFPNGYQMIMKGIVSKFPKSHRFLVDAPFNKGLSGGLVLAVRDGIPNFEVVGIVTSSAGDDEPVLVPSKKWDYAEEGLYLGPTFVEKKSNIKYGITFATSADAVVELIKDNKDTLNRAGYYFGDIIR